MGMDSDIQCEELNPMNYGYHHEDEAREEYELRELCNVCGENFVGADEPRVCGSCDFDQWVELMEADEEQLLLSGK